jgi:HEAT repeat protein
MTSGGGRAAYSPDELRRVEHVERLVANRAAGLDELLGMLGDPSWIVRRAVVAALAASGTEAVAPLCQSLRARRDSEARIAATVDSLAALSGDADVALVAMLGEVAAPDAAAEAKAPVDAAVDAAVLADVVQILGRRRARIGLPAVVTLTRHPDDNVAVAAIEALGRIGGRAAVDSLVDAVQSRKFFRTFPAIDLLGRSGDPRAVAPLTTLLGEPPYAAEAARALGRTGDLAAVVPLLGLLARAGGAAIRVAALALDDLCQRQRERLGSGKAVREAIYRSGGQATVRQLILALDGADPLEQAAICFVLGALRDPSAVPALTGLLDAIRPVADAAGDALRRLGPGAEEHILRGIREGDVAHRRALLPLVSRASSAGEVAHRLDDADPEVRALACDALARLGATALVGALFPLLADANPRVSYAAMAAIQSLGSHEAERLAMQATRSSDARVRRAGLRILSYCGSVAATEDFLGARTDPDERVRESAIQGLAFIDDPRAIEALFAAAGDPSERMRAVAMRSLGQCSGDLRVSAYLLEGLNDPGAWVRYYACQALGKLAFEPAADAIIRLLRDPVGQVRVAAVEALSSLKGESAIAPLKAAVLDDDSDIQRAAIIGLGVSRRAEALPLILAAAASADPATRLVALSAVAGFPAPEVVPALREAACDPSESVRTAAIGFLAYRPGVAATRALTDLLRTAAPSAQVLDALSIDIEGRLVGLVAALEEADDETAASLTSALARLRGPNATAALIGVMTAPNVAARKAAASVLGALATEEALAVLQRSATEDPEREVRQICSLLVAR